MGFNLKEKVDEIVEKLKKDPKQMEKFQKEPVKALEELLGVDLPDDQVQGVIDAVKAKISVDKLGGMLGGLFGGKK